jgi:hypothetical protein
MPIDVCGNVGLRERKESMTEETLRKHLPMMNAWVEGKTIQYFHNDDWFDCLIIPSWDMASVYRIKPTPSLVPWTQEDVPPVCWVFRDKEFSAKYLITAIHPKEVSIHGWGWFTYEKLLSWSYSTDLKTWKPCGREA